MSDMQQAGYPQFLYVYLASQQFWGVGCALALRFARVRAPVVHGLGRAAAGPLLQRELLRAREPREHLLQEERAGALDLRAVTFYTLGAAARSFTICRGTEFLGAHDCTVLKHFGGAVPLYL